MNDEYIFHPDYLKESFVQQIQSNSSANEKMIKIYATNWCGDCRMARRWFDAHGVPYEYINIEEDDRAAEYVVRVNHVARTVPTIFFPNASLPVKHPLRKLTSN